MKELVGRESTLLLIIAAAFVTSFLVVCAVAYLLMTRRAGGPPRTSTWQFSFGGRLPVSKRTFDFVSRQAATAMSPPEVSTETRATLEGLARLRGIFAGVYRATMLIVGLIGLVGAAALFHTHTPGNMHGLPGAIILLLALGALLSGLIPPRSVAPDMEPIDRRLLDRIKVMVTTSEPRTISLSHSDLERAAALLRQGRSIRDAARAAYPDYEALDETEKRAVESMLAQAIDKATGARRD